MRKKLISGAIAATGATGCVSQGTRARLEEARAAVEAATGAAIVEAVAAVEAIAAAAVVERVESARGAVELVGEFAGSFHPLAGAGAAIVAAVLAAVGGHLKRGQK